MCKEYLVLNRVGFDDWRLCHARRFNEEEKAHYVEGFREYGFVLVGDVVNLEYIESDDCNGVINERKPDGAFCGCDNAAFIIDGYKWETILAINEKKKKAAALRSIDKKIAGYKELVENCEKQGKLYTKEEAKKKKEEYIVTYNEGGEGYVPHYYTFDEHDFFKIKIDELSCERKKVESK